MKFLFVISNQTDYFKIGGIENSIRELVSFLLKNGHQITIFQIGRKKGKVYSEDKFGKIEIYYGSKFIIRCRILVGKFSVINFIQTPFENLVFILLFYIKKTLSKTITCKFFFTYPPFKKHIFFQSIKYKYLIDKCFAFSKRLASEVQSKTRNVTILFPPVSMYYNDLPKKKEENSKTKILFAGRLSKDKGLDVVIDVYRNLDRNKYFLSICGYFANENDKLFYTPLINSLNIDYLDISDQKKVYKQISYLPLHNFDILLLPYQDLAFTLDIPLLVLEGLVAGCNVVTSNIGDISLLEGNIYTVDNYSDCSNFSKMIRSSTNKEYKNGNYKQFLISSVGKRYLQSLKYY